MDKIFELLFTTITEKYKNISSINILSKIKNKKKITYYKSATIISIWKLLISFYLLKD